MRVQMGKNHYWREATRHEDSLQAGIADVSFVDLGGVHGWMELKQLDDYPAREESIVRVEHFTDKQKIWLRKKGKAGGSTWLFMQIKRDYYLFRWNQIDVVGQVNAAELARSAFYLWKGKMDWERLGDVLCCR